ncbi:adenosylmethionine decarboxylase [Kingella kingae]|uniref:S-adenosylmethionine decarboxylase proenzyme n=2 Tax=Kingella kingae TaxID=504 RepID=F5S8N4_KINKI|nr:adenosylmethionine decarboxylase [Kingella kingae]EGK08014.1 adenosylmethionine decarboxylase [Kingella kingae ATCC 23330]MDK4535220.1 adenosylmethionine decarboxylase [Kingella kingae]MDK4537493.1 adenosylmethionine decarboxylase [Kingella kingae]MDK4541718.1 adenosylmethionine decarboxylase [Kingella kingae]MDK4547605.1 adenosylmethionine decarboxylase [Kingella kingae]
MTAYFPGQHGLLDLYDCDAAILCQPSSLQRALHQAAQSVGATILFDHFHHFGAGGGVTGVLLLAESHISIHTWAEHRFAAADIFVCGELNPQPAIAVLQAALAAERVVWTQYARGEQIVQKVQAALVEL